jgi:signal transduction histidine kinase
VQARLARKLFLSYLLILVVGVGTLLLAADAVAPTFLVQEMGGMMPQGSTGGMMGGMSGVGAHLDATLQAGFLSAMADALRVAALVALAAAVLVSLVVARQITQPVARMLGATRRIAAGHYAERVPVALASPPDELGQLAASFNEMAGSLEQTERRRLELIGDIAHELRTPIATLEGYLEGLLDGVVEPSPPTWARLHDEAGRLRRLVDDLQELSRAEARQIPLRPQPIVPSALVQAALDRVGPQFVEKGLTLQSTVPTDLPDVQADLDRAVQVLTNLLTNALRYTPAPGTVQVTAGPQDGAVAFSVTDSGLGIAPEHLPHLFERFYRVDKSRSRAVGGSGIGLTIARAFVEAMGGRMEASSAGLGRGSTFTFTLPVAH